MIKKYKEIMEILDEFITTYKKRTKHNKKCLMCGKLLSNGDKIVMRKVKVGKYYPIKGLMGFVRWQFFHNNCLI